jgi:hypothetical protein
MSRFLVGIGGLAFSMTLLWLSMRVVMGIGGSCASGGPYVPAVECPDIVVALTPLAMLGLFAFGGLAAWGAAAVGGSWMGLIFLAWPALFLSLGWNFLEFGLDPPGAAPGELAWGWLICAVVFGLMGGVPLIGVVLAIRDAAPSARSYAGGRVVIHPRPNTLASTVIASAPPVPVADRLDRLARLRRNGDLTDAEFEAAKRATLEGDA